MALNDLTTLARVKQYLDIDPSDTSMDAKLSIFITRISAACLGDMSRDTLLVQTYDDMLDGTGNQNIMLQKWPVLSVASVNVNTLLIQSSINPPIAQGFWYEKYRGIPPGEPSRVLLSGFRFTRGKDNVVIGYNAGYGIVGEKWTVPDDPGPYVVTPAQPYGLIAADNGVTYANGTPLVPVAASPDVGEYVPPQPLVGAAATSIYTFSPEDANAQLLGSYSYIPDAVEGAVCQWVAEQWAYKDRLGVRSKSLGGQETISFIVNEIPAFVKLAIQPYRNVIPLQ